MFQSCGFESQHCILDGHFSHIFVVKIVMTNLKRPKINDIRGRGLPIFIKKHKVLAGTHSPSTQKQEFDRKRVF